MRHKIFKWKTPTNYEDKKPRGLRSTNINPLFKIKLHKFTWPLYPKDLLSSTYNLIHVCDTTTPCCSLVDPLTTPKELRSLTNNSNIQIIEWKNESDVAIRLSSQGVPLSRMRGLWSLRSQIFWSLSSNI